MTGQHTGVKMPSALQTVLLETDHETLVVDYMALRDVTNKIVALAVAGDTELCAKIVEWAHDDTSTSLDPPSAIAPASPDTPRAIRAGDRVGATGNVRRVKLSALTLVAP